MEWIVTTGRTVDEAREAALDELGVAEDELELEILDEPKSGLFGMVRREARVRARVAPATPRPKVERRPKRGRGRGDAKAKGKGRARGGTGDRRRGGAAGGSTDGSARSEVAGPEEDEPTPAPAEPAGDPAASAGPEGEVPGAEGEAPGPEGGAARSEVETVPADPPTNRSRRRRRGRPGAARPTADGDEATTDDQGGKVSKVSIDEQVEVVEEFLDGLLEAFDLDGEISSEKVDEDTAEIKVEGDDLGLLIGPKGQTLSAVQDLSRTVVQRRLAGSLEGRIRIDVGGYRARRKVALERFAQQVAEDVLDSGSQKVLEPMSPPDRKIVHDVINEIDGVTTASEGEEPRRRVVVRPVEA